MMSHDDIVQIFYQNEKSDDLPEANPMSSEPSEAALQAETRQLKSADATTSSNNKPIKL